MEKRIMSNKIKIIKKIKEEHNLPNDVILDLVTRNNGTISESSLKRVFEDDSEDKTFRYSTIEDLYNALTKEFGDDYASDDPVLLKNIIAERNNWIDRLVEEIKHNKEDFSVRELLYAERKANYERTIGILQDRIDKQDEMIKQLMDKHFAKD